MDKENELDSMTKILYSLHENGIESIMFEMNRELDRIDDLE